MLSKTQRDAIRHLAAHDLDEAAEKTGVSSALLQKWMQTASFRAALRESLLQQRLAALRIATTGALMAAKAVERAIRTGDDKTLSRCAIDLLKISGIFTDSAEAVEDSPGLADLVAAAARAASADGGQSDD